MNNYSSIIKNKRLATVCRILLMLVILVNTASLNGQVVNKRLYLKNGLGLSRVLPVSAAISSSVPLVKQSAVLGVSGNVTTSNAGSTTGSLASVAITPTGASRLLLVSVGSVVGANNAVSGVTFGGVALTKLTQSVSGSFKVEFWFLKNPNATAGAVQINWPAGNLLEASVGISALSNVDLVNTFTIPASTAGSTSPSSLNVPSAAGDIIVDAIAIKDNSFNAAIGQTELYNAGTNSVNIRSSWKPAATGVATQSNMSWNGLTGTWVTVGVGVKGFSNDVSFTQSPAMCSDFIIRAGQTITLFSNAAVSANTASGAILPISAELSVGGTIIFSSLSANNVGLGGTGSTGTLTWTGTIGSDVTVLAGQPLVLTFSSEYSSADIRLDFDATSKISYAELPTQTYINVNSVNVRNAASGGGSVITQQAVGVTNYIRSVVSDPFGFNDITGMDIRINGGAPIAATSVATAGCTRTYEHAWTPAIAGAYTIQVTAKEGTEGTVTHVATTNFTAVRPSVSVVKTKTAPTGASIPGSNVTYNIAITNTGLSPITTLPLQDIFNSASLQYVSAIPAPTTTAAGLISWNNVAGASLAAGATTNVSVTFTILSNSNPLNNTARVEGATDNLNYTAVASSNTVAITVSNLPDAIIDRFFIQSSAALNVLLNDTDIDVVGSLAANSSQYNVTIETTPLAGSVSVNGDKTIQFNTGGLAEDQAVFFKYRVTEIATGLWDTATVFVKFSAVNNPPAVVNDVAATIINEPVTINVLNNDADIDGELQIPTIVVAPANGSVVINADKSITYTPYNGFVGTNVFTYRICDNGTPLPAQCANATVTVSVINALVMCQENSNTFNVAPVAGATSYTWTIPAGATVSSAFTGILPNPVTTGTSITINWNAVTPGFNNICARPTNNCGDGTSQCLEIFITRVVVNTAVTNVLCRSSKTGAVNLTVSGGRAPYTYAWTGPSFTATIEDISALGAGTYNVTVTDKYGCVATTSVAISQPATSVSVSGTVTSENPFGSSNGAITITPAGGTAPYSYLWSTGSVSKDISNISGGTYTVTVTDANGCPVSRSFTVASVGAPLQITSLTKTNVLCFGASTGTIDLEVIGGTGTYTYAWTGPSGFTASTQDLAGLAAGTYAITVSDGSTTVSNSITITQPATAISASAISTNVLCNGGTTGSITVTVAGGITPYTYLWSNGATTKDLSLIAAGTYSVIISDANGCNTTVLRTITQPASPLTATGVIGNSNCAVGNNGSIILTPTGGTAPYTYSWSNGATTKDISTLTPGNYSVVITDAAGCSLGQNFLIGNSCIGLAKEIAAAPINNLNGSYSLTYTIKIENKGTVALNNIQVVDNLNATFTGASSYIVNSVSSGSLTVNNTYNGNTNTNLLAAPLGALVPGEAKFISINVTVVPGSMLGVFNNSAAVNAQDVNGLAVADVSQNGTITDPDNDGNTGNNSVPTPLTFIEIPKIGVAKILTGLPVNNLNGSYNVGYTITVKNVGNVPIRNVQVTDNLATTFGGAPVSVLSISSSLLAVNNSYNGTTNTNLLLGSDNLAVNEIRTIIMSVLVRPASLATYNNTAIGIAQGPGGTTTTDNSQNGIDPDPDNDDNPNNNSAPTPVVFTEAPEIGVAKQVVGSPVNLGNGTYALHYRFIIKNIGNVPAKNIQLTDNLSNTFPGKVVSVDSIRSSTFTRNNGYNGTSIFNLLTGVDSLPLDGSAIVNLYIKVTPGTNLGPYNNTATTSANGPLGTSVSDVSNNGIDVDPENDGAGNNSIPTPVSFLESPSIGFAKTVSNPVNNGNGTYSLTYTIKVENKGDVPLNAIEVHDQLNQTFTGASAFVVNSVSTSGTFIANNTFNGTTITSLLGTPGNLPVAGSANILINVTVTPGAKLGIYYNRAYGRGTSSGGSVVSDTSTTGSVTDPDNDGNPKNNDTLTAVQFVESPLIGIAKRVVGATTNNGNGTYTFTYEIKVVNVGDVPLRSLQLADNLRATFPAPSSFTINNLIVHQQPVSSTLTTNGSYNGINNTLLLNGTSSLAVGETGILRLTITVNPGGVGGPFYNSANGFAISPGGRFVFDNSDDGTNVDPDNDGDPANDNDPTPITFFENPIIGISKRVVSVTDSSGGMNKITLELKIKNYGDVELRNLVILDNVAAQFASVSPANYKASAGSLFANATWNGTSGSNILQPGQFLAVGDSGNVFISFTVIPGAVTTLNNLATTQASTIMGVNVSDTSTNGLNPDINGDGNPRNDSVPTPVLFNILNEPPVANWNYAITPQATPVLITILSNDTDPENNLNPTSVLITQPPVNGSISVNPTSGVLTYTPNPNFFGRDTLVYRVCDGETPALCDTAIVFIDVKKDSDKDGVIDENDIDDDNDGITDYVETCGVGSATFSCMPGGADPSADDDSDGIVNYKDAKWCTLNGAGACAFLDADSDGIPDFMDRDSDNDGVPDVIEAGGVDANGDGNVDNFCDTDGDGLSQTVDGNISGSAGSGQGLGSPDFDGDGLPNNKDLDSDNDGIPDLVESFGTDANNDGRIDVFADTDGDGMSNLYDGDADGNGTVENVAGVLILSQSDPAYINCSSPGTGRATCYALRGNNDGNGMPNFLDLDSDGDGITDANESGITATGYVRGMVSGCTLVNGWCTSISSLPSLNLTNTDNVGRPDVYDIDSDNDGITDNIEAQPTSGFVVANENDSDGDGLGTLYDFFTGIGGNGITPYDHDADGFPDYRDIDTDNDGAPDRNEGDKTNATLLQTTIDGSGDSDGDGLMNYFDAFNLVTSCTNVSMNISMSNMGNGGSFDGPIPGASMVQLVQSATGATNRDWRNNTTLPLQVVSLTGSLTGTKALLEWKVLEEKEIKFYIIERSVDGLQFNEVGRVNALNRIAFKYDYTNDITGIIAGYIYYRIIQVNMNGSNYTTNVVRLKPAIISFPVINIYPNPVVDIATISVLSVTKETATIIISDMYGKMISSKKMQIEKGVNKLELLEFNNLPAGVYMIKMIMQKQTFIEKIVKE